MKSKVPKNIKEITPQLSAKKGLVVNYLTEKPVKIVSLLSIGWSVDALLIINISSPLGKLYCLPDLLDIKQTDQSLSSPYLAKSVMYLIPKLVSYRSLETAQKFVEQSGFQVRTS